MIRTKVLYEEMLIKTVAVINKHISFASLVNKNTQISKEKIEYALNELTEDRNKDLAIGESKDHFTNISNIGRIVGNFTSSLYVSKKSAIKNINNDIAFCHYVNTDATKCLDAKRTTVKELTKLNDIVNDLTFTILHYSEHMDNQTVLVAVNKGLDFILTSNVPSK